MIFVTVGTTKFDSLIREIDNISTQIKEKIVCQIAKGKYIPNQCEFFRFKPTLKKEFDNARLIICHGGAGTLFELLKMRKKIIAIPNLERKDKHQKELVETLSIENLIIPCRNVSELKNSIETAKEKKLKIYTKPECRIAEEIIKFIGE